MIHSLRRSKNWLAGERRHAHEEEEAVEHGHRDSDAARLEPGQYEHGESDQQVDGEARDALLADGQDPLVGAAVRPDDLGHGRERADVV